MIAFARLVAAVVVVVVSLAFAVPFFWISSQLDPGLVLSPICFRFCPICDRRFVVNFLLQFNKLFLK